MIVGFAVLAAAAAAYMAQSSTADDPQVEAASYDEFDVLVFSRTNGWRHDTPTATQENAAITAGKVMIQELGDLNNFNVTITEDNTVFSEAGLEDFEVVFFLNTTSSGGPSSGICPASNWPGYNPPGVLASGNVCGDMLTAGQQEAFEDWFRQGNGWVGSHSASDTEKPSDAASNGGSAWPWYGGLLGNNAWFASHGGQNDQACLVKNPSEADHISVSNPSVDNEAVTPTSWEMPSQWTPVLDEWYSFINNPLNNVTPTAAVPHTPISVVLYRPPGGNPGTNCANANYPAAWYHEYDGGRAFYTARGHGRGDWREHIQNGTNPPGINPNMRNHILGGILYAAGVEKTPDPNPPVSSHELDPATADGNDGWYTSEPLLTITAEDDIAPANQLDIEYRINGGVWMDYTAPIAIGNQGDVEVEYRASDPAGNVEEPNSFQVTIDTVAPSTSASTSSTSVTLTPSDATSGVASTQYCVGTGCTPSIDYTEPISPAAAGTHTIRYRSTDAAGNVESIKEVELEIEASDQMILIDIALPPVSYGSPDLTVNPTATPSGLPVTMTASGACSSVGTTVSLVTAGECSLDFNQAGDAIWNPASLNRTFEVRKASTTASLSAKGQVKKGKKLTLKSTVNTGAAAVSDELGDDAQVDFFVDGKKVGSSDLDGSNKAQIKVKAKGKWVGHIKVHAVYTGNDRFDSAKTSKKSVKVKKKK